MSYNMGSTFQAASQGDEFFDYAAASGESDETLPSSVTQTWASVSSPWNAPDDFAMADNNHGALSSSSFQDDAEFPPNNNNAWSEMAPTIHLYKHQPANSMTEMHNLPEESNIWASDSSNSQTSAVLFRPSVSTQPHVPLQFDPSSQTASISSSQWDMDDLELQVSKRHWALPADSDQSGLSRFEESLSTTSAAEQLEHELSAGISGHARRRQMIQCPWPSCMADGSAFEDEPQASVHFDSHKKELLQCWSGPTRCSWPNCSSKLTFKEKYLFDRHLANIHVTPLCCPIVECSRTEPFGKNFDLKRHIKVLHDGLRFFCPVETCDASVIGFARKYNVDKHLKDVHDNVRCTLNHCGAVILDRDQESHVQNAHGDYECALLACGDGAASYFTWEAARLHLISVHKIYRETAQTLVLHSEHTIRKPSGKRQLVDCQGCLEQIPKST